MQETDPLLSALQRWTALFMQRSMHDFLGYARQSGLSMSQLGALFQVRRRGRAGVTDLGDDLGITISAASQMLDRLVQQGLVVRSEAPDDRRVKQIALTDKGAQVLQESLRAREGWLSDLTHTLSASETSAVIAALDLLIDRATHLSQPAEPGH